MLPKVHKKFNSLLFFICRFPIAFFWGASHSYVALRAGNIELVVKETGIGKKKSKSFLCSGEGIEPRIFSYRAVTQHLWPSWHACWGVRKVLLCSSSLPFSYSAFYWGASHSYGALRAGNIELVVIKTGIGRKKVKKFSLVGQWNWSRIFLVQSSDATSMTILTCLLWCTKSFTLFVFIAFFLQCIFWGASHSYGALRAGNIELIAIMSLVNFAIFSCEERLYWLPCLGRHVLEGNFIWQFKD